MRPIKVEFQAFGPYAGHEMVDFEAVSSKGLFLICGKTGIGKTMILDAMTFALFGKSSGHGRDDFESMRCTNAPFDAATFVKFEFENNREYYLFERRLERKRKNLSAAYNVSRKGGDGIWHPLMENAKEKDVNAKAAELIGLEYEQFRQVIVLPQGQFERLLTSNSDEKEKILTSIFGEDKWQVIAEHFYDKAESRRNELKGVQEKIKNSLAEENCDSLSQLESALTQKKERAELLDSEYQKADHERIIKEQQEILAIARRFSDLHKAEEKVKGLEAKKEERALWEKSLNDARRAEKVRAFTEAEKISAEALRKRKIEEEAARKTAQTKKKSAEEASERLMLHIDKEKDMEALRSRKIIFEGKRRDYDGLEEAERELKEKEKAAFDALKAEEKAKESSNSFAGAIVKLQEEYTTLQAEHGDLLNSYLAGITGELAEKLKEGEPCPVCGSTEHPNKAKAAENSVTRAMVDSKKKAAEQKYRKLQEKISEQDNAKKLVEDKHAEVEKANTEVTALSERLDSRRKNLAEGIATAKKLEEEIEKLQVAISDYEELKQKLLAAEKAAKEAYLESETRIGSAEKETEAAGNAYKDAEMALEKALKDNKFETRDDAEELMLSEGEMEALSSRIAAYDADLRTAEENLKTIKAELDGREEPDEEKCREILNNANNAKGEYREKKGKLSTEIERLDNKLKALQKEGQGIEGKIREAEEDFVFAKKLRGDSGTGLQRYVLGIMFSSVVAAANRMLEMVHGGRYRLYRSDEKAQGTNKRGLELKVFDRNSEEHEGRFVSTLSGGEKFLASLALSIGMSAVAQKSGIKIEALFIDEGFGSLDDDSIGDAMNVLNSIQEANGLVGIISHVRILQDQIPSKLCVEEDERGSHIVQTIG